MLKWLHRNPVPPCYAIGAAGVFGLWDRGFRGQGVQVALLDTGLNSDIPQDRIAWQVDLTDDNNPFDFHGHGSLMAGFILRMAPECRIINVKVGDRYGFIDRTTLINALDLCKSMYPDVRIVNISVGVESTRWWRTICTRDQPCTLCRKATELAMVGWLLFAAVGNRGRRAKVMCPAAAEGVWSVGALEGPRTSRLSRLISKWAPWLYYSTSPYHSGTSISAAFASGSTAALL
jgi:subtilisin